MDTGGASGNGGVHSSCHGHSASDWGCFGQFGPGGAATETGATTASARATGAVSDSSAPGWLRRKQGLRRPGRQRPGLFGRVVSDFTKYLIFDQKRRVVFSIVLVIFSTSVCTHSRPRAKLSTRHSYEFRLKAISVNVLHMDGSRGLQPTLQKLARIIQ